MLMALVSLTPSLSVLAADSVQADPTTQQATSPANIRIITGKVVDASGDPMVGATVTVKDSREAAATNINGDFSIKASKGQQLLVSYIGCNTAVVDVTGDNNYEVVLHENTTDLDEVVVVGYATQKKVNLTGSVSAISAKDIENKPVANTATLLQGRLPGLVITSNGAQAGNDNPEIRIRGIGTFNNNNPMVLIDGVEGTVSQIADIPAADIESISVLKDAASAAIYGVRAGNGVILITTKSGTASDKPHFTYNGSYTIQHHGQVPDYVDSYFWAQMVNDVKPGYYDATALQKLKDGSDPDHYANEDWLGAILRTAGMQQHNFSVSGGNQATQYSTSVNYTKQDGIVKRTGVERMSFRTSLRSQYKRFSFGLNAFGSKTNVETPGVDPGSMINMVTVFTRPTVPVYYSDGRYGCVDGSYQGHINDQAKNIFLDLDRNWGQDKRWLFNGRAFAGIDIWEGIHFQTSLAYVFDLHTTKQYYPDPVGLYDFEGNYLGNNSTLGSRENDYWYRNNTTTWENILTFDRTFGKHSINVLLGHSAIRSRYYENSGYIEGFPTNTVHELNGGSKNPKVTGMSEGYSLQSFFGRLNYIFDSRYLVEFNIRRDGSSRLPKSGRWGTFPSVSAGWIWTAEDFWESFIPVMNLGKIRASWGKLGNQEIGNYLYSASLGANANYIFDQSQGIQSGMAETNIANDKIKWETTKTVNIGLDVAFLNNRVTGSFEWFDKNTSDILMKISMPGTFLGTLPAPVQNVGKVRNRGWELTAAYQDGRGDWTWNASFTLGHVKNKITDLGELKELTGAGTIINRVGYAINSYYGWTADGLFRTQQDLDNYVTADGTPITINGQRPVLGDIRYVDINGDGQINAADRDIIGNPFPKFSYGFNLGATWKNFDLSTFWQGVSGVYRYSWETTTDVRGNYMDRWYDRYTPENIDGKMPRLGGSANDTYSSFWLEDASYLRLKNLEFGYTFRQSWLQKASIESVRFYFNSTNLLTFTKNDSYDPEKPATDTRNYLNPSMKTFSFGVNLQF